MALSDQLTDLATRTKHLEDVAAAAEAEDRAKLERDREKLHSAMSTEAQKLEQAGTDVRSWWNESKARIDQQRAELRGKLDQRRAEREVAKAERNAADAEQYAADVVTLAAYMIDSAEYAVIDAAIARAEADDLAASR